jgi:hypothetical protein
MRSRKPAYRTGRPEGMGNRELGLPAAGGDAKKRIPDGTLPMHIGIGDVTQETDQSIVRVYQP